MNSWLVCILTSLFIYFYTVLCPYKFHVYRLGCVHTFWQYICYGKFVFLVSLHFVYLYATLLMHFSCKQVRFMHIYRLLYIYLPNIHIYRNIYKLVSIHNSQKYILSVTYICNGQYVFLVTWYYVYLYASLRMHFSCKQVRFIQIFRLLYIFTKNSYLP